MPRYARLAEACKEVGMKQTSFRKFARDVGAVRKIGAITLYDLEIICAEIDKRNPYTETVGAPPEA